MSLLARVGIVSAVASATVFGAVSCGTTSNNDQGTSFTATGYFSDITEDGTGVTGARVGFGSDTAVLVGANGSSTVQIDGNELIVFMGLENHLTSQFLRVQRIDCSYEVQGADPSLRIPNDSYAGSTVIPPAASTVAEGSTSSTSTAGTAKFGFAIISTDIFSFLTVNQNRLPERPFNMTATCSAVGISQAGDVFTTNEAGFSIVMSDAAECCTGSGTTPGFQNGVGTGGTIVGGSSSSSSSSTATVVEGDNSSTTTE